MSSPATSFDWNQARAFLATAESGSLSAAARDLGQTQPTIGRQIAALEETLGVLLFDRAGRGLKLTEAGRDLLIHIRTMDEAATRFSLAATGRAQDLAGEVSVTATDITAATILPPIIARLAELAPEIRLNLIVSNDLQDLTRREADIAIRHVRPTQNDLTARLIAEGMGRMYAATTYLDRAGRPKTLDDLAGHRFIAMGPPDNFARELNTRNIPVRPDQIRHSADNGIVYWALVEQGLGIGVMSDDVARTTKGIEVLLPDLCRIPVPVWLVTHRELHMSKRIRLVFDLLADALKSQARQTRAE